MRGERPQAGSSCASQALAGATTASAGSGEELPEDSDSEVSSASVCPRKAMTILARGRVRRGRGRLGACVRPLCFDPFGRRRRRLPPRAALDRCREVLRPLLTSPQPFWLEARGEVEVVCEPPSPCPACRHPWAPLHLWGLCPFPGLWPCPWTCLCLGPGLGPCSGLFGGLSPASFVFLGWKLTSSSTQPAHAGAGLQLNGPLSSQTLRT